METKEERTRDNPIFKQVGGNIGKALEAQGKTQQFLADQLGISKQVMSKIIAGAKAINVAEISKISEVLHISVDSLLEIPETPQEQHSFAFMGQVENAETREKIDFLRTVIDEILMLEEYADAEKTA